MLIAVSVANICRRPSSPATLRAMAHPMYGSGPLQCRNAVRSERIYPVYGNLDEEINGLHSRFRMLKGVAQEINSEAKFQNDFLNQLQMTLAKKVGSYTEEERRARGAKGDGGPGLKLNWSFRNGSVLCWEENRSSGLLVYDNLLVVF